ncbi:MAG: hypothetical protein LBT62_08725 [Deltaproteobacteria bacterium]|nr:hypothetical protein [Deltaproteobacteria bacterium]
MESLDEELKSSGFEIVDIGVAQASGRLVARVFIDKVFEGEPAKESSPGLESSQDPPTSQTGSALGFGGSVGSGITLDDCVGVSGRLSALLDEIFPQQGPEYILEVSSPGLNRVIRAEADFRRFNGRLAKIKIKRDGETTSHTGRLATNSKPYKLETKSCDVVFDLDMVVSARLEPEI